MTVKKRPSKFERMCQSLAAIRCRQAGQSYDEIAKSAKRPAGTVRGWVSRAGFKNRGGSLRHVAESIVEELLTEAPKSSTLQNHKQPLSPEEQAQVDAVKLPHGDCATFWKAEHEGKTWYVVHTHRAGQVRPSLKSALAVYPKIASTA